MPGPGRRPGPQSTRARILAAARSIFAEAGYERATVRAVAGRAGVDPALIHYYFGSKHLLFVAATELPIDPKSVLPEIAAGDPDRLGERLVHFFLTTWDDEAKRMILTGVLRSATTDSHAAALLRELIVEQFLGPLAQVIDRPDARIRATLVGSTLVGLAMARYVIQVEPLASADPEVIVGAVGPTVQRYLSDAGASFRWPTSGREPGLRKAGYRRAR